MNKVILLKGLPASGKSTYAKQLVLNNPNQYKRINRDSLRKMFAEDSNQKNEKFLLRVRDQLILQSLEEGYDVVIDDLNLSTKNEARIRNLVGKRAEVEIDDHFLDIPLDELISRNSQREDSVPEKVIRDLYSQFVGGVTKETKSKIFKNASDEKSYIPYNDNLKDAVIFDIDGTLALMNGRSPFDWSRVGEDLVHEPVARMFHLFADQPGVEVFVVSGRDSACRKETKNWLLTYGLNAYSALYMRPEGNQEKDSIIKERIYREHFEGQYNVIAVFDDRNQTVEKWRELGLFCLQVAPGNF